jgi:hypothetical protein
MASPSAGRYPCVPRARVMKNKGRRVGAVEGDRRQPLEGTLFTYMYLYYRDCSHNSNFTVVLISAT